MDCRVTMNLLVLLPNDAGGRGFKSRRSRHSKLALSGYALKARSFGDFRRRFCSFTGN